MKNSKYVNGYIEGYYGKLLSWEKRKLIINSLFKNKMNTYLYAPKEDINHRFNWKEPYENHWRKKFRDFTKYSQKKNVNVIAGIAPGLDFNFIELVNNTFSNKCSDFNTLVKKSRQLLKDGAYSIALLLDDIPDDSFEKISKNLSEGYCHGLLINKLSEKLDKDIYFVPRVYADELNKETPNYLLELSKVINKKTKIFYSGKNIISKNISKNSQIFNLFKNKIIIWDNFYANDYCPRRLFVGPYIGRKKIKNIMINPTGLINTDLLIIDIVANTKNTTNTFQKWKNILDKHDVPKIFQKVKIYFVKPNFNSDTYINFNGYKNIHSDAIEFLLWSWKSELSREWYPFLFGLKQDLLIYKKNLSFKRLLKTQTIPLAQYICKELEKEN